MKATFEVWLETVKDALARGESAVVAVSKANLVTNSYAMRFVPNKIPVPLPTVEQAKAWFEQLASDQKAQAEAACGVPFHRYEPEDVKERAEKYEKPQLPIPPSGPLATELGEF